MSKPEFSNWKIRDRYVLEKLLGKGSYGQVAQGMDRKTGKKVAVKFMEGIFHGSTDSKRAYREMHILRHMSHPNIIGLVDVISPTIVEKPDFLTNPPCPDTASRKRRTRELGDLYLVFDFVDTDLSKIFKSDQYMLLGHVQFILYQLLLGMKHIHTASVIHRDIKPANILISCVDCSVKIADFGLARVVAPDATPVTSVRASNPVIQPAELAAVARAVETSFAETPLPVPAPATSQTPAKQSKKMPPTVPRHATQVQTADYASIVSQLPRFVLESAGVGPSITLSGKSGPSDGLLGPPVAEIGAGLGPAMQGTMDSVATVDKPSLRRQLTHHVITRWYRAPEVILCEPYDAAVDIWSIGCIFAELLGMIRENISNFRFRRPLFPGESCGELSPGDAFDTSFHDGGREQLSMIFNVIGTPTEDELRSLHPSVARDINSFRKRGPEDLSRRFPACDEVCLSLLRGLLTFDPAKRLSIDNALRHPFLGAFHNEERLQAACSTGPMRADIESICEDPDNLLSSVYEEIMYYQNQDLA